jgi:predicted oxidoreductase
MTETFDVIVVGDAFGKPIPRLYVAGELGSVFGHLYISGGDYAECLVGGRVADRNVARLDPWSADTAERTAQPQAWSAGME